MRSRACLRPFTWGQPRRVCTVGDYLQLDGILAQIMLEEGQMHCLECGGRCRGYAADEVEREVASIHPNTRCLVAGPFWPGRTQGCGNNSCEPGLRGSQSTARSSDWKATGQHCQAAKARSMSWWIAWCRTSNASVPFLEAVRVRPLDFVGADGDLGRWYQRNDAFEPAADLRQVRPPSTRRWPQPTSARVSPWPAK